MEEICFKNNIGLKNNGELFYERILRYLIATSFVITIINPSISGLTFYLWIPLIFLDFKFLRSLRAVNKSYAISISLIILSSLISGRLDLMVKYVIIISGVIYIKKVGDDILDKILRLVNFSICVCVLQFILYEINPAYARLIGPSALAQFFWGTFATSTYTNQYVIAFLPRMSGLSREAGFFVSLITISYAIRLQRKILNKKINLLYFLGFIFSQSKASFGIIIFIILYPARKIINKIPVPLMLLVIMGCYIGIAKFLNVGSPDFFNSHASAAQRLSAAYFLFKEKYDEIIIGCNISDFQCSVNNLPLMRLLELNKWVPNMGIPGLVIDQGVVGFLTLFIVLMIMKVKSFNLIVFSILTSTVPVSTIYSFVVLTSLYLITNKKKKA